jgi:hypothetical protein
MAYAGTPTGLAQQSATRPWKTLLTAIAVLAIGLAMVIAIMFIGSRAVAPTVDRGYDQIEAQRGAATLSGAAVKSTRFAIDDARGLAPVKPWIAEDNARGLAPVAGSSSDAVTKAAAAKARAMSGVPAVVDKSYDAVESARGVAPLSGTKLDATSIDQSRGAHGPLP